MDSDQTDSSLQEYRSQLVEAELSSQTAFDRTLLALSGGALGLSLTFFDRLIGPDAATSIWLLWASWIAWAASLALVLISHYFSTLAMRTAIGQVDSGTINQGPPGGVYDRLIQTMNPAGGILFLAGVVTMIAFAIANLE